MDIKEALTFDGLKYFYTKYIKPLKTGAFSTVVNNATTTVANTVLDGRMGKTLADKDANLQSQINTLNSSLATYEKFTTDEWYIGLYGGIKVFVYNHNIPSKWIGGYNFALNSTNLLPVKYRPQEDFGITVTVTNTGETLTIDIRKSGSIYIRPNKDLPERQWITVFVPYI